MRPFELDNAVEELFARLARDHGVSTCLLNNVFAETKVCQGF